MPARLPLSLALGRFKQLPQRSAEVWQGGLLKMPVWIGDSDDPTAVPTRPMGAVWVSHRTGLLHIALPEEGEEATAQLALTTLIDFGLKSAKQLEGRPAVLEVGDAALRDALAAALVGLNTSVVLVDDLPLAQAALDNLETSEYGIRRPSALEVPGVTIERLRAFADAAARFYGAQPWNRLPSDELVVVESPKVPTGMGHVSVMGSGGQQFGLSFFPSRRAFDRLFKSGWPGHLSRLLGVTFGTIDELPFGDVDAWEAHALPLASPRAYPLAVDFDADGNMARLTAPELTHVEGLLRGLAETTDEELDSGRWQRQVETVDGVVTLTLSLPMLLEAEARRPRQGHARRGNVGPAERAGRQVSRFLEQQSLASPDEANAAPEQARQQGLFDALDVATGGSLTPLEQAQELAYEAIACVGRLQIKRARQALALSPDCADAWIILANGAGSDEQALAYHQQAVDAGARAIGVDRFDELAGQFWGHIETRPYMRARLGLAERLRGAGRLGDAIELYRELVRLNPNDNQGVRYRLVAALLEAERNDEAVEVLDRYPRDVQATWPYARALATWRSEGDSPRARAVLADAVRMNRHVVPYLLDPGEMPVGRAPHFELGSKDEATEVADDLVDAYERTPGALEWLRDRVTIRGDASRRARAGQRRPRR